jgi:hypothetical protein
VGLVLVDNELFFFSGHGLFTFLFTMAQTQRQAGECRKTSLYPATESTSRNGYYNTNPFFCKGLFEIFFKYLIMK